jgi:hypothetical protein
MRLTCPGIPDTLLFDGLHVTGVRRQSNKQESLSRMKDFEDNELKSEMDEIMRSVESIMKKVETVLPPQSKAAERTEE